MEKTNMEERMTNEKKIFHYIGFKSEKPICGAELDGYSTIQPQSVNCPICIKKMAKRCKKKYKICKVCNNAIIEKAYNQSDFCSDECEIDHLSNLYENALIEIDELRESIRAYERLYGHIKLNGTLQNLPEFVESIRIEAKRAVYDDLKKYLTNNPPKDEMAIPYGKYLASRLRQVANYER